MNSRILNFPKVIVPCYSNPEMFNSHMRQKAVLSLGFILAMCTVKLRRFSATVVLPVAHETFLPLVGTSAVLTDVRRTGDVILGSEIWKEADKFRVFYRTLARVFIRELNL